MGRFNITLDRVEAFANKFQINQESNCWEWTGAKTQKGYGQFGDSHFASTAHRFAYLIFNNEIDDSLTIDHLCRNTSCVNPKHLEQVSRAENVLRGNSLGAINKLKTHCRKGHEYTPENTYHRQRKGRNPERDCLTCRRQYAKN